MALDLNNSKVLEAMKWHADRAVRFDLFDEARMISEGLPGLLIAPIERPETQIIYQNILVKMRFVALPVMRDQEIIELMQDSYTIVSEMPGYDLWSKLKTKLISIPQFEDRDALKQKIREALLRNDLTLTNETVTLGEKELRGTVKNWLTDYHEALGTEKVETVRLSQYLINGANTKKLKEESRARLDYLLKFYEKLKYSSSELEGIEETTVFNVNGEMDVYQGNVVERIGKDVRNLLKELQATETVVGVEADLEARYRGDEKVAKRVESETKKIKKSGAGNFKKLVDNLLLAAAPGEGEMPDKIKVEAILKVLAESGKMEEVLEEKKIQEMMESYFRGSGMTKDLNGFKINPRAPEYVSHFLRHLLRDVVRFDADESGRIGMQIFDILSESGGAEKYQGLVYFDMASKEFRWAD